MSIFFGFAIVSLLIGHLLRCIRWTQIVQLYEKTNFGALLRTLTIGYFVDYLVPFHIGEMVRAVFAGKIMRNGISFSLATIVIERYMDVVAVCIMYIAFMLFGIATKSTGLVIGIYMLFAIMLFIFSIITVRFSKVLKSVILRASTCFNSQIQLNILFFSWAVISSLNDIFKYVNKIRLYMLLYTILMWSSYIASYNFLSMALSSSKNSLVFLDIFNMLFAGNSFHLVNILIGDNSSSIYTFNFLQMGIYILLPLIIMLMISFVFSKIEPDARRMAPKNLLPHIGNGARLDFLKIYFSDERREYIENYLKINRNISILKDVSAGSNATTLLCIDSENTFYRKYAFGAEADKLHMQVEWLKRYQLKLPLTAIESEIYENRYCYYDMPYTVESIDFFTYIHTMPVEKSWKILLGVIRDLEENLYSDSNYKVNDTNLCGYILQKVSGNLLKILNYPDFRHILRYDELEINGITYNNLNCYLKYFTEDYLVEIFSEDRCSDIHGDLTIENIICTYKSAKKKNYFLIDPNSENIHNSPNLDYAKVLQSLHGNYEFLMKTDTFKVDKNSIEFLYTRTTAYSTLLKLYENYLSEQFSKKTIKSIYFHEIIHWFRLMPHKMEQDQKKALIFYCGMIIVINDIFNKYGEK